MKLKMRVVRIFFALFCLNQLNVKAIELKGIPVRPTGSKQKSMFQDNFYDFESSHKGISIAQRSNNKFTVCGLFNSLFRMPEVVGQASSLGLLLCCAYFASSTLRMALIPSGIAPGNVEKQLNQIHRDYEEVWNSILSFQQFQSEVQSDVERNGIKLDELQVQYRNMQRTVEGQLNSTIEKKLDSFEVERLGSTLLELTSAVSSWEGQLQALEVRLERVSAALHNNVEQLRQDDIPSLLEQRDSLLILKLQKFKDDLKGLLFRTSSVQNSLTKPVRSNSTSSASHIERLPHFSVKKK
jgi:hypothetical protein